MVLGLFYLNYEISVLETNTKIHTWQKRSRTGESRPTFLMPF